MEHAHDETSLVHYRRPRLPPPLTSGSSAFAFSSHDAAWSDPALSQSISSASSAGQSSSSSQYSSSSASHRSDREYDAEASASFVQHRYPSQAYGQQLDRSQMNAGFEARFEAADGSSLDGVVSRREPRGELLQVDERYASFEPHSFNNHARDDSPEPHTSHYYGVIKPIRSQRITSRFTRYDPYYRVPTSQHSDSASLSEQGSNSPALSVGSEVASSNRLPLAGPSQLPQTMTVGIPTPRQKNHKQRLYSVDRRNICIFAQTNPTLRQEDIAKRFGVERSTISKILKDKDRWLKCPEEPTVLFAKWRTPKYISIENDMIKWVKAEAAKKTVFTDAMIRNKALEFTSETPSLQGVFKASPGWVENFKARHGIRKGVWHGEGTEQQMLHDSALDVWRAPSPQTNVRKKRVDVPRGQRSAANPGEPRVVNYGERNSMGDTANMDGMDTGSQLGDEEQPSYQSYPSLEPQAQHETVWQQVPTSSPVYEQVAPPHDSNFAVTDALGSPTPIYQPSLSVAQPGVPHDGSAAPIQQDPYVTEIPPGHHVDMRPEPQDVHSHLQYSHPPEDDEPDYEECIEVIGRLCNQKSFRAHAELTSFDDDVLTNLAKAIMARARGTPHHRTKDR